jgi:ATP-dependent RNA helicase DHX8/PRP22
MDDIAVRHKIYTGHVTGIRDFGCFVALDGIRGKPEGLVHISALREGGRVMTAGDVVKRNQFVHVKVLSVAGDRISLSMREVDQDTGRDLNPQIEMRTAPLANPERPAPAEPLTGVTVRLETGVARRKPRKRLTSPERWERNQLVAAGVLDPAESDEEVAEDDLEEDVDVELVEEEPTFLRGQTRGAMDLSPIRVIANPEGSLLRAAMTQGASLSAPLPLESYLFRCL